MSHSRSSNSDSVRRGRRFGIDHLLPSLTSGVVIGLLEITLAISLASLIFSGPLVPYRALGIGLGLLGAISSSIIVALFTSQPGTVGGNQEVPAVIMSLVVADLILHMPDGVPQGALLITVLAAIALTTFLTGFVFLALGYFRLGNLVRFLPYPVVGGFLAATGWLLISGAVGIMVPLPQDLSGLAMLFEVQALLRWLPGIGLALLLLLAAHHRDDFWVMPLVLLGVTLLFYGAAWAGGLTVQELQAQGWLLGPFAGGALWRPFPLQDLNLVQWPALAQEITHIGAIVLVSVIGLLLNAGGVELASKRDLDLNRELRAAGVGNIFSGMVSGLIGYQQLGLSAMNFRLGSANRLSGLVGVAVSLLALLFGASLLSLVPQMIVGGLLAYLGFDFLYEWIFEARKKLPIIDYVILLAIVLVTITLGFVQALTLGLLLAVALFVVGYSRVEIVRHEMSGKMFKSRVVRPRRQVEALAELGDCLYILQLQGFIFFGTADQLLNRVRHRLEDTQQTPPRVVYLDFHRVTGLDSTGLLSFRRMRQLAVENEATLAFVDPSAEIRQQLEKGGLTADGDLVRYFSTLDIGLQWGEDRLLVTQDVGSNHSIWQQLKRILHDPAEIEAISKYFQIMDVHAGQILISYGQEAHDMFIVESGQVTAQIPRGNRPPLRLESIGGGHVVGEIGLYLGQKRTAEVVVDEPGVVYRLSAEDMQTMEDKDADAAAALHRLMVCLLAERVTHLTNSFNALAE